MWCPWCETCVEADVDMLARWGGFRYDDLRCPLCRRQVASLVTRLRMRRREGD